MVGAEKQQIALSKNKINHIILIVLICLFLFRLIFGLCSQFWSDDERQIYLLGLKFYTTRLWPYFGPDVVYTGSQIPGALQSLLVGIPLYILPIPESPFFLLNILSFFSLCLLAWYCKKHVPQIPQWFVLIWIFIAPWVLNISTHIYNPSYVLFGAIIFFVAIFELCPPLSKNIIPPELGMFMIGFAFFWIFQLHMSWVLLCPFTLLAFYFQFRKGKKRIFKLLLFLILGAMLTGSLILPTFIKYGLLQGSGGTGTNIRFRIKNLLNFFAILARFLSFAGFEISRFVGSNTLKRLAFLKQYFWIIPFLAFACLIGVAQPITMIIEFFKKKPQQNWKSVKLLTFATVLLLYFSFLFSIKGPSAHTFYLTLPVAMLYFFYCFQNYFKKIIWRKVAIAFLISGIIVHIGIGIRNFKTNSLYKDRKLVIKAIQSRDYTILGHRRKTKSGIGY